MAETTPQLAKRMFDETGVAGVMIGRGAIGNPWIFEHISTTWKQVSFYLSQHFKID